MLPDFQKHIDNDFSFLKNKKLLIANSGGIDSAVLTFLMHQLEYNISLAHCNFNLRAKESDLDEKFVKNETSRLHIPFFVTRFDTNEFATQKGISIQMAARELRYKWFEELLDKNEFDFLLTAHHADDNLETFLINFSRGTGLSGLLGIPHVNNKTVRPLLQFSRKEIEYFAKEKKLTWREDQSNLETKYLRNKLRHDVIPLLKEINPNLLDSFSNTLENLKGSNQIVEDRINKIKNEVIITNDDDLKFKIEKLKLLNNPKAYLFELFNEYGFTEWNDVLNLLDAQSGKQVFSKTHQLLKDRDYLVLSKIINKNNNELKFIISSDDCEFVITGSSKKQRDLKFKINTVDNHKFDISKIKIETNNIIYIDKSLLTFPLTVRKWEKGDYFYPIGMRGKKKLSKYFKDEKLSLLEKENIWLLCSENEIIWVVNNRLDDRFKITNNTKNILKIEIN